VQIRDGRKKDGSGNPLQKRVIFPQTLMVVKCQGKLYS
jgi:hypothetical protein